MKKLYSLLPCLLIPAAGLLAQEHFVVQHNPSSSPDLVRTYVRHDPASYKKQLKTDTTPLEFAVQLSASSRPVTDKGSLRSWEEIAPVFIHTENGLYKVRLGPFDTQELAKQALLKAKSRGKKDAFIVVQKGLENHVPFEPGRQKSHADETPAGVPAKTIEAPVSGPAAESTHGEYKVRLASYLKPGGFSTKDIDQYGALESYRQGEWTILLIGGFKTRRDAERVKDIVVTKGFHDARVVVDIDGILQ